MGTSRTLHLIRFYVLSLILFIQLNTCIRFGEIDSISVIVECQCLKLNIMHMRNGSAYIELLIVFSFSSSTPANEKSESPWVSALCAQLYQYHFQQAVERQWEGRG